MTCSRIARAERVSLLVDAAAYYGALRESMLRAQTSIVIVGWDVDSRVELVGEQPPDDGLPTALLPFLNALLDRNKRLHVHILSWDFAMIYAFERELLPSFVFSHDAHRRLHHVLDGQHPATGSHHQKIVVVDDQIAFCGGVDLTIRRWDTAAHHVDDARRTDPKGVVYGPMHDVQLAVDGDAASALGLLCHERWKRATGAPLSHPGQRRVAKLFERRRAPPTAADAWPSSAQVDFRGVDVGIARTVAAVDERDEPVHEVSKLALEMIRTAQHTLYVENQYLTSAAVVDELTRQLQRASGPEIVLVLPKAECGWMEQSSMGVLRARALSTLHAANEHGHLHIYYPVPALAPAEGDAHASFVNVHSKVMIVDDRVLKVGSSNLSNRSMGLDTECDLVIEAQDVDLELRASIAGVRDRLLGEHLGMQPSEVAQGIERLGSISLLVAERRTYSRRLEPLTDAPDAPANLAVLDGLVVDPERPVSADVFMRHLVPNNIRGTTRRSLFGVALIVFGLLAIALAFRFTPLRGLADTSYIASQIQALRAAPLGPLYVVVAFVCASLLFVPITALIAATTVALPPLQAFACALLGSLCSASIAFAIGGSLGRKPLLRLLGRHVMRLRPHIERAGLRAIVVARLLPVGNFTAINLLAGALVVPFRAFVLGNIIGLMPGLLGLSLLADRVFRALRAPTALNVLALVIACVAFAAGLWWLKRALAKRQARISALPQEPERPTIA